MELVYNKPIISTNKKTCLVSLKHVKAREYFSKEQLISYVERVKEDNAKSKMKYWRNKRKKLLVERRVAKDPAPTPPE
uniref:Uncharacterized protein n=1 Tax=Pithovirus LCPAC304 TaxID=2506594 RepID=A0A481ZAG7_9VIRU|nr:MAG: hypothetical protein LCPAC304_06990 [Pithovirus LCPAC304]